MRWMATAIALATRTRALSIPNPNIGCVIIKDGRVVGRGWTQPGGRPHAEAMALAQVGARAQGATAYVSLEPCAHTSPRGPSCAGLLATAGVARVVVALTDPDPRTNGKGIATLNAAGIEVQSGVMAGEASASMAGWLMQHREGRPFVTLKLATSLDGCIAASSGESQWITGETARAHGHLIRAQSNLIIVGRGTYEADHPRLDVRIGGLEARSPERAILGRNGAAPEGWLADYPVPSNLGALRHRDSVLHVRGCAPQARAGGHQAGDDPPHKFRAQRQSGCFARASDGHARARRPR